MKILDLEINKLTPYENNPRNNLNAVDIVAKSIQEFGFKNPIVVDKDYTIINGHTRYQAAIKLGLTFVPVIVADDLSEEQIKAFRIMDNKSSEFAEWDYEKLLAEIKDIEIADFDVELTGFDVFEIDELENAYSDALKEIEETDDFIDDDNSSDDTDDKGYSIQYNLVFNTEEEQSEWYDYLTYLKKKYPEVDTIAERVLIEVRELMRDE